MRGYLKNKIYEASEGIYWCAEPDAEDPEDALWGLGIDYSTMLTNGSKVLYKGR